MGETDEDPVVMSCEDIHSLAKRVLLANTVSAASAEILAQVIMKAERDGPPSHGLAMLPKYVSSLRCGWVDGQANYITSSPAPGVVSVDGNNGFAQIPITQCRERLVETAQKQGIAVLAVRNAHHIGALRGDVEALADLGVIAIAMSGSRPWLVPWQGEEPLFGTNPMAFACPCQDRAPIVWDQASSAIAVSDIRMAAEAGKQLPEVAGLDSNGQPTCDAGEIMKTGRLLPFGRHKGTAIALMVEIMAVALTGSAFAIEDRSGEFPGASSSRSGQLVIAIDPQQIYGNNFPQRIQPIIDAIAANGEARIPGDGRLARRRRALTNGVPIDRSLYDNLQELSK
jgi:delta1-piperideine-2-carboxylate reductase